MTVTETLQGLGGWDITVSGLPREIADKVQYFGHIVVHPGRVDYRVQGDSALTSARYVGVIQKRTAANDTLDIGGPGMSSWLGDSDQKGSVFETPVTFTNSAFAATIRALLPASGAVTEGTLFSLASTFTGSFVFQSPREAIDYVCETVGAEWRVNGNATLDAGLVTDLFVTNPKTLISRRLQGADMQLRSFLGKGSASQDVADFSTRVVLLAQGAEASTVTATADINPTLNPFVDLHGNPVELTRLISESTTDATNAPARAQLQINRFSGSTDALKLSTSDYDVKGDISVGDYAWVLDEEIGLQDNANEIIFEGFRCNPMKLRMIEITFPVTRQMAVGYRAPDGTWWNLTDYIVSETGETQLVVGDYKKSLSGADGGVVGSRPQPDTSIPGAPTWVTPFGQVIYQNLRGDSRAQVQLQWLRPNNEDGSSISDGDHYEVRYRQASTPLYPVTWSQAAGYNWNQLHTWDDPIQYTVGQWQMQYVPWSDLNTLLQDLLPSMPYEAQIRAVDGATPANYSVWSTLTQWQTNADTIPPSQPAAPIVYTSRIAAQVEHHLGALGGGEYNLEPDLHHLEIHGEYEPNFTPSPTTLLGKILANGGMITGHIPAVGTVPIESTMPVYFKVIAVDNDGNQSLPSPAVQQTAELIDDAHISNLTVSKLTAGTITSDWILGASIKTATSGPHNEIDQLGIRSYDYAGREVINLSTTGQIKITDPTIPRTIAELGIQSADGTYGMSLINSSSQLLRLNDFVFGPKADRRDAEYDATGVNNFWGDLPDGGPTVTVKVGPTRRVLIFIGAIIAARNTGGFISVEVFGASSIPPGNTTTATAGCVLVGGNGTRVSVGRFFYLDASDGLNEGDNIFLLRHQGNVYSGGVATDTTFSNRQIVALPY